MQNQSSNSKKMLILGAIGVVFGDIGTSPLYTLKECFKTGLALTESNILGLLSLIFWAVFLVVSIKYIIFVMRADNNGEGGILSLISLVQKHAPAREKSYLMLLGLFGAAMFYGDSMITPAISVLSAVEGLEMLNPNFHHLVIPIAIIILVGLFWVQRKGTAKIGKYFGPIMLIWFSVLGIMGIYQISQNLTVLYAVTPLYAMNFIIGSPLLAFILLGAIVLALTGGEALYADMGHFGRPPIKYAWFGLVMPCLMLNYFGQGAFVMTNPDAITSPFYSMAPSWALIPLIILATFATVIASQAVISGAFSMTKQAIALGYMPRLSVIYTSDKEAGQIYVPFINIILFIAVVLLVITFKNSHSLASAYGIAVTMTMLIDTILVFFVMKYHWKWSNYKSYLFLIVFAAIDIAFLASNSLKIMAGGWFPLLLGGTVFFLMTTWKTGRDLVRHSLKENSLDLYTFMPHLVDGGIFRVQGTAIFLNSIYGKTPVSFMHNLKHNKVLHETVIFFTMQAQPVPYAQEENRIVAKELAQGVWQVTVQLGFKELPDVPQILNALAQKQFIPNWEYEPMDTSFFLSRETVLSTPGEGMAQWRERLFGWMSQNATRAALYFNIPPNRVVELGAQVCI